MKTPLLHKTFLLLIVSCSLQIAKAQWVSIPDTNFGKWLNTNGYVTCMQGNSQVGWQMDTSCPVIVNDTSIYMQYTGIRNLNGIQYFDNLISFTGRSNGLMFSLYTPVLPASLKRFEMESVNSGVSNLPIFPAGLEILVYTSHNVSVLPNLPPALKYLDIHSGLITSLPILPNGLEYLNCGGNRITSLPTLPTTLTELHCFRDSLTQLSGLPSNLKVLNCGGNRLGALPQLPSGLEELSCFESFLSVLPTLPITLTKLNCDYNQLTFLPNLPSGLTRLWCMNNPLVSLPTMPTALENLDVSNTQITVLPALPPVMNGGQIECSNSQLNFITNIPDSLWMFRCSYNPDLTCLPELRNTNIFSFEGTGITCLPNYPTSNGSSYPDFSTYPLCSTSSFNIYGCGAYWNIAGKVYKDTTLNCIYEVGEKTYSNFKVTLYENGILRQQNYTLNGGHYSFNTDFSTYKYSVDTTTLPLALVCPDTGYYTSVISVIDSFDNDICFGFRCKPGFDLEAHSIVTDRFRPGNFATIDISAGDATTFYGEHCASGTGGTVTITIDGPVSYISPASGALIPTVGNNTLIYNIADFGVVDFFHDFNFILQTDTTAALGSQVCITVSVTPTVGDNNPANNTLTHCFTVVGSFDPNDKTAYPAGDIDTSQEWLTYTVRFQNTGTAEAQHIYITDTLDSDLDLSSFQLLAYSHQPMVQIKGNEVRFNFPNINLPDSGTNEPQSHGYVQYKVKLKDNLPIGTVVNNTAFIYFDFNAPVVTNTTTNTIALVSGIHQSAINNPQFEMFPNPASDIVTISVDETMLGSVATITDLTGRRMTAVQLITAHQSLVTSAFANGIYLISATDKEGRSATKKLAIGH